VVNNILVIFNMCSKQCKDSGLLGRSYWGRRMHILCWLLKKPWKEEVKVPEFKYCITTIAVDVNS